MSDLIPIEQKLVDFNGSEIMAVKCNDGNIYAGVKWFCDGLGFSEGQRKGQYLKIQEDLVLSKGGRKIILPTTGGTQEVLCLELSFLPLWLAKINANIIDNLKIQDRLVDYQLNAKDILAEAFLEKSNKSKQTSNFTWDRTAISEIRFAKEFAKAVGIRPERAMAVALARIEKETGKQLGDYRKALPSISEEDAERLNAGQIGNLLNPQRKASEVNLVLEKMGLQYGKREPGKRPGTMKLIKRNPWNLTDNGKEYGIMQDSAKQQAGNKWEGFQIMWSSKTVGIVQEFMNQKSLGIADTAELEAGE